MYSPRWGRFTSQDPIGLLGGPNLYAFVGNSPMNAWDPFGLAEGNPVSEGSPQNMSAQELFERGKYKRELNEFAVQYAYDIANRGNPTYRSHPGQALEPSFEEDGPVPIWGWGGSQNQRDAAEWLAKHHVAAVVNQLTGNNPGRRA